MQEQVNYKGGTISFNRNLTASKVFSAASAKEKTNTQFPKQTQTTMQPAKKAISNRPQIVFLESYVSAIVLLKQK